MNMNLAVLNSSENVNATTPDNTLVDMIKKAVCDEFTASFQYRIAINIIRGLGYSDVIDEYKEHFEDEEDHLKEWLERLEQLDIKFDYTLVDVSTKGNAWVPITVSDAITQLDILIKAEHDAAEYYGKIVIAARAVNDLVTEKIAMNHMLDETEHAKDLTRIKESLK